MADEAQHSASHPDLARALREAAMAPNRDSSSTWATVRRSVSRVVGQLKDGDPSASRCAVGSPSVTTITTYAENLGRWVTGHDSATLLGWPVSARDVGSLLLLSAVVFVIAYPVAVILIAGFGGSAKWIDNFGVQILIYVLLGWGLNIVIGLAGLLNLGYVAFFAIGAYTVALLGKAFGLSFWVLLPLAGIFAAVCGVVSRCSAQP